MPEQQFWLTIIQALTNVGVIIAAVRVTIYLADIRFKVDLMWRVFESKFERRGDEFTSRPEHNQYKNRKE